MRRRALVAVAGLVASVDHYVAHAAPGTSAAEPVPALLTSAVLPVAPSFRSATRRRGVRRRARRLVPALVAFLLGAFAPVFGAMRAWHAGADRLAGDDLTGPALLPAGIVAFALTPPRSASPTRT